MTTGTATTMTTAPATPKTRTPHPLRAEAVRGFAPLAGAAVLLMLGVLLTTSSRTWQGGWAETAALVHNALLIALPLAAAAGCWQGGRERRRRTEELWGTAVRAPLQRLLASALPVALWVAVGYLLAVALAALATWPYSMGDHPHLTQVPGDTAALMAAALLGHLAGRTVPTLLTAPLLGVAGYAGLGIAAHQGGLDAINPAAFAEAGMRPVWWQPLAMAAWTLGLSLALTLAYAARRRATALLPLAAALTAGALLVQGGSHIWRTDPITHQQVCDTSTTPAICVNARYAGLLPQVRTALSGVTGRLRGVQNLPARWADRHSDPRAGEAALPTLAPFGWSVARGRLTHPDQYAWEAVAALSGHGDCENEPARGQLADEAVQAYLAPNPFQSHFDARDAKGDAAARAHLRESLAARAKLAGMDEQRRRTWLSAYFAARAGCGTEGVPSL
ncbi:hypothetical protein [Streptomyces sp. NPDC085596]|uniref:hypothetical protein n=1 Tax=Streptomyces sp. NPDC085596 TaxID=3365731 RepID=UPI0037D4FCA6